MNYMIIDIDNTICIKDPNRLISEYNKVYLDKPIKKTIDLIHLLWINYNYNPIFITARLEDSRAVTETWLRYNLSFLIYYNKLNLYMKSNNEFNKSDSIVKKELLKKIYKDLDITKENIKYVFEDDLECIKMYNKEGFFVINVNQVLG